MDLSARLDPVLDVAGQSARDVDADARFPAEAVAALRESGLLGLTLPVEAGGLGGGPQDLVTTIGSLAGVCGSTAMVYLMHISAAMPIAAAPPPGLPGLVSEVASGRALASLALSEAGSRSHFWAPVSQAKRNGNGIRLQAAKSWVTSAGHADVYVVSTLSADTDGDVGKHGDTGRSELDALRAVLDERADAAAIGINTWEAVGRDELMPGALEAFWTSPTYSHCNFTALPTLPEDRSTPWVEHLFAMDWDNPDHQPILQMEGLRKWVAPHLDGYASLIEAVREQGIPTRW